MSSNSPQLSLEDVLQLQALNVHNAQSAPAVLGYLSKALEEQKQRRAADIPACFDAHCPMYRGIQAFGRQGDHNQR